METKCYLCRRCYAQILSLISGIPYDCMFDDFCDHLQSSQKSYLKECKEKLNKLHIQLPNQPKKYKNKRTRQIIEEGTIVTVCELDEWVSLDKEKC